MGVPITARFSDGGASPNWGPCLNLLKMMNRSFLFDCTPHTSDSYEIHVTDPKKTESRGRALLAIDRFARCAKQHTELFRHLFGKEHRKDRRDALRTMIELRESQPDLFAIAICVNLGKQCRICTSQESKAVAFE